MVSLELKMRIKNEYQLLTKNETEKQYSQSQFFTSSLQQNSHKNRYKNIPVYETTRVKLCCDFCMNLHQEPGNNPCQLFNDDYINANYISSPIRDKHYIACQGPLPHTALSFWRMVWQHNVSLVIMLTLIEEDGCVKCYQYFPDDGNEKVYGDYVVSLSSKTSLEKDSIIVRELILKNKNQPKTEKRIYHAQYCNWPDQSIPESVDEIISLIHMINNFNNVHSPIVVHCSAGIGRTGTILSIMNCIASIRLSGSCDVAQTLMKLREERYGCVTAKYQYKFIYTVIIAYITKYCIFSRNVK